MYFGHGETSPMPQNYFASSLSQKKDVSILTSVYQLMYFRELTLNFSLILFVYTMIFVRNVISPPELNVSVVIIIITHSFLELR